jgi:hypothetical protein
MKVFYLTAALICTITIGYSQQTDTSSSKKLVAPWFVDKFKLTAGFFYPVNNTKLQVNANGSADGTEIDLNKDLGFNSEIGTFLASFQWRISRRSRVSLGYYDMHRSTTHTLQKDINFGDNTYHVNSTVNSFFNTAIYQFSYGYAIIEKPKYELGVLIGTHTVGANAGITLNGTTGGSTVSNNFGFTAPLPDLGIWGGYAISDRFCVNLDADYLSLTVGNYTGSILAYNIIFGFKMFEQLDLSLGYTGLNFKVSTTKKDLSGDFKWGYNGPTLAATFSFGTKSWIH